MYKNINVDPPEALGTKILIWEPEQRVTRWYFPRNIVQHWRFYMNDSPGAMINRIPVRTDEILLIPPGLLFAASNSTSFWHFYIHFKTGELYNSAAREIYHIPRSAFGTLPEQLLALTRDDELEYVRTLLYAAIFNALRMIPNEKLHVREKNPDKRIVSAGEYIRTHWGENLLNSEVSKRFGLSVNRFIRLFRDEIGVPPQQYQQLLKVEHAMRFLTESSMSIEEIADAAGFSDRFHFSRVFRKITGETPAAYRKQAWSRVRIGAAEPAENFRLRP